MSSAFPSAQGTSEHELKAYPQENTFNPELEILSLTSEASSSQPHSSPFDSPSNYSPPPPLPPGDEVQSQEYVAPSNVADVWETNLHQGSGDGEKVVGNEEEWNCWVNFDADPDQAS